MMLCKVQDLEIIQYCVIISFVCCSFCTAFDLMNAKKMKYSFMVHLCIEFILDMADAENILHIKLFIWSLKHYVDV